MSEPPTPKLCCLCERDGCGPTPAWYLVKGQRWHHGRERWVVFRGYVCEMHLSQDCEKCAVVRDLVAEGVVTAG